jgi:aspartyl protease family protein
MDSFDFGRLLYLVLLGAAIGGYLVAEGRKGLGKTVRQAAAWGFIFLGAIAGYGLWDDIRSTVSPQQMVYDQGARVEVPRARDGHFYLTLDVNGAPVNFVVDTGASDVVLTLEDARRAGIDPDTLRYVAVAMTANGQVPIAPVRLDELKLGDFTDRNVRASVSGGELFQSLLGMSYLSRFERLEIARDRLILTR